MVRFQNEKLQRLEPFNYCCKLLKFVYFVISVSYTNVHTQFFLLLYVNTVSRKHEEINKTRQVQNNALSETKMPIKR